MKKGFLLISFIILLILLILFSFTIFSQVTGLRVQYKTVASSATTNAIQPHFNIYNDSTNPVNLSDLEIRYYYQKEGLSKEVLNVDYSQVSASNITGTFVTATETDPGYLSITFNSSAGQISAGGNSGPIELRFYKSDYSDYNQSNDYSFNGSMSSYSDNNKIGLYHNGTLVWGPDESQIEYDIPLSPTEIDPVPIDLNNVDYPLVIERAVWFFDANKCGPDAGEDNVFTWRGPCHTSDGNAASLDLTGGFHDAGDHVKFGLPQAFSASLLGWSLYEYRDTFDSNNLSPKLLSTLKYFTDYFLKSHPNANTFYYQVGDGNIDHSYWGSPETQTGARPVIAAATPSNSCSDVTGMTASALALMYLNYKNIDSAYANKCLTAAIEIYDIALNDNSRSVDGDGTFYESSAHYDDLSWGAIWLSIATGDSSYLNPVGDWQDIAGDYGGTNWQFEWAANWDNITPFVMLKMAELTGEAKYHNAVKYSLDWYRDSVTRTPGGLPYLDSWAVLRYAANEAGYGYLANKLIGYNGYNATADLSIAYILGDNPRNSSYITQVGNNPPLHPHHRANEPSKDGNTMGIIGALVGGPASDDSYTDSVNDYTQNEVALDYNASLVFGLAGKLYHSGPTPPTTPPRTTTPPVTTPPVTTPPVTTPPENICGDVNSSGTVDIVDALLISQYSVGNIPEIFNQEVADVNGDGSINIMDALIVAQYSVGIVDTLSCS